jgi:hypothetical protein
MPCSSVDPPSVLDPDSDDTLPRDMELMSILRWSVMVQGLLTVGTSRSPAGAGLGGANVVSGGIVEGVSTAVSS